MMQNKLMSIYENIGGFTCLLELGKWTPDNINVMLSKAYEYSDPSDRLYWIMQNFIGVRFEFESMAPILPEGVLRVRLESMDCITYIYNMLALCKAKNFNDYVLNLYNIRYLATEHRYIDSNPDTGNILDFAEESLLLNAINTGFLLDITGDLVSADTLINISVNLKRFQRNSIHDANTCYVAPRFGDRMVTERFIPVEMIDSIDKSKLKSGDIVLLSEGPITKHGIVSPVLISHLAITYIEHDEIYFYHATRHFSWRPDATHETLPAYTGVFLDKNHQKEIIGTAHAGIFAGDETETEFNGLIYFGLNQKIKRPLIDFASRLFKGVKFLRVSSH